MNKKNIKNNKKKNGAETSTRCLSARVMCQKVIGDFNFYFWENVVTMILLTYCTCRHKRENWNSSITLCFWCLLILCIVLQIHQETACLPLWTSNVSHVAQDIPAALAALEPNPFHGQRYYVFRCLRAATLGNQQRCCARNLRDQPT